MLSPIEILGAIATITVGATVQSSAGFGLGLVAAPILLIIEPAFIPGPLLVAGLAMALLISVRDRKGMDLRGLQVAILGRIVGIIPAIYILSTASPKVFSLIFASFVLMAVFLSLLGFSLSHTPRRLFVAGMLSGLMATVSSIGGPPIALIYQRSKGLQLRGTLSGYFTVGAALSLLALLLSGQFDWQDAQLALLLLPGIGLGFMLSRPLVRRLEQSETRPLVLGLSFSAAIAVLVRTLYT